MLTLPDLRRSAVADLPRALRRARRRGWPMSMVRHPVTWLSLIAALPIVIAAGRAIARHWVPEGDDAIIAARIRGVFHGTPPVQGMRSTSGFFDPSLSAHHPGPLEFYLDAPVAALFGFSSAGIVIAVAVVNIIGVVAAVVLAHRMRGLRTCVPVVAAILLAQWMLGPDVLARPFNPYPGALAVIAMIVGVWAVLDRDPHGLWVMLLAGSYAAQCNLAFCPLVLGVCLLGLTCSLSRWWKGRRRRRRDHRGRRRAQLTTAVVLLAWLPSIIELFTLHPNNVQMLSRFVHGDSTGDSGPTGVAGGIRLVLGNLSPDRLDRLGVQLAYPAGGVSVALGVVVVLALVLAALSGPRVPHTAATRGCWVILAALAAESAALALKAAAVSAVYWLLPIVVLAPLAYAVLAVRAIELLHVVPPPTKLHTAASRVRPTKAAAAAVVVGLALSVVASVTATDPERAATRRARSVDNTVLGYLHQHARSGVPVRIAPVGAQSYLSVSSSVGFQLLREGYAAHFLGSWPYREDMRDWYIETAPATAVVVTIADADSVGDAHPAADAVAIPLTGPASDLRAWIAVPPGMRAD